MSMDGNGGNTGVVTDDNFRPEIAEHGGLAMVDTVVGAVPKPVLERRIQQHL
ncbi:MAG TPA: hypothetical protein VHG28_13400 [Longimicrobiaceae bacterium]|nr:hypothetical protein [Longimicrobiaceae bacterium]